MRALMILGLILSAIMTAKSAQAGDIKNRQDLLGGFLTRAGVKNQSPLSESQLKQLCEEGYRYAYFLYKGAPNVTVRCSRGEISYKSTSMKSSEIMANLYKGMVGEAHERGKTFVHCNNGAHASNTVAAIALRQFCGYSADAAGKYWRGHMSGYALPESGIRGNIATVNKQPLFDFDLSADLQNQICGN